MFFPNIKSQWRHLKNWLLLRLTRTLRNPSLLKGAITTGVFVYRLCKMVKDLVEPPDG